MTVNCISDIHAITTKTGSIVYGLPARKSLKKCKRTVDACVKYLESLTEEPKIDSKPDVSDEVLGIRNPFYCSSLTDAKTYAHEIKKIFDNFNDPNVWENISIKDKRDYTLKADSIDNYLIETNKHWSTGYRLDADMYDVQEFMRVSYSVFDPSKLEPADYLIIAGDLGTDNIYDKVLADITEKTKGKFKKILHIAGNHDHWWIGHPHLQEEKPDHVNLEHDYCIHEDGDYLFLGCTLWTPIPDRKIHVVGRVMNDYRYTPGRFTPYMSRHQYEIQSTWLRNAIMSHSDKKIVVFTHHQPFVELTADDYKHNDPYASDNVNEAYVVTDHSLDDINEKKNIVLWQCGHTHQTFDDIIHDVHVVRNPIGYTNAYGYMPSEVSPDTWYNKIIEI